MNRKELADDIFKTVLLPPLPNKLCNFVKLRSPNPPFHTHHPWSLSPYSHSLPYLTHMHASLPFLLFSSTPLHCFFSFSPPTPYFVPFFLIHVFHAFVATPSFSLFAYHVEFKIGTKTKALGTRRLLSLLMVGAEEKPVTDGGDCRGADSLPIEVSHRPSDPNKEKEGISSGTPSHYPI